MPVGGDGSNRNVVITLTVEPSPGNAGAARQVADDVTAARSQAETEMKKLSQAFGDDAVKQLEDEKAAIEERARLAAEGGRRTFDELSKARERAAAAADEARRRELEAERKLIDDKIALAKQGAEVYARGATGEDISGELPGLTKQAKGISDQESVLESYRKERAEAEKTAATIDREYDRVAKNRLKLIDEIRKEEEKAAREAERAVQQRARAEEKANRDAISDAQRRSAVEERLHRQLERSILKFARGIGDVGRLAIFLSGGNEELEKMIEKLVRWEVVFRGVYGAIEIFNTLKNTIESVRKTTELATVAQEALNVSQARGAVTGGVTTAFATRGAAAAFTGAETLAGVTGIAALGAAAVPTSAALAALAGSALVMDQIIVRLANDGESLSGTFLELLSILNENEEAEKSHVEQRELRSRRIERERGGYDVASFLLKGVEGTPAESLKRQIGLQQQRLADEQNRAPQFRDRSVEELLKSLGNLTPSEESRLAKIKAAQAAGTFKDPALDILNTPLFGEEEKRDYQEKINKFQEDQKFLTDLSSRAAAQEQGEHELEIRKQIVERQREYVELLRQASSASDDALTSAQQQLEVIREQRKAAVERYQDELGGLAQLDRLRQQRLQSIFEKVGRGEDISKREAEFAGRYGARPGEQIERQFRREEGQNLPPEFKAAIAGLATLPGFEFLKEPTELKGEEKKQERKVDLAAEEQQKAEKALADADRDVKKSTEEFRKSAENLGAISADMLAQVDRLSGNLDDAVIKMDGALKQLNNKFEARLQAFAQNQRP